jgi:hypothetical protein
MSILRQIEIIGGVVRGQVVGQGFYLLSQRLVIEDRDERIVP